METEYIRQGDVVSNKSGNHYLVTIVIENEKPYFQFASLLDGNRYYDHSGVAVWLYCSGNDVKISVENLKKITFTDWHRIGTISEFLDMVEKKAIYRNR